MIRCALCVITCEGEKKRRRRKEEELIKLFMIMSDKVQKNQGKPHGWMKAGFWFTVELVVYMVAGRQALLVFIGCCMFQWGPLSTVYQSIIF